MKTMLPTHISTTTLALALLVTGLLGCLAQRWRIEPPAQAGATSPVERDADAMQAVLESACAVKERLKERESCAKRGTEAQAAGQDTRAVVEQACVAKSCFAAVYGGFYRECGSRIHEGVIACLVSGYEALGDEAANATISHCRERFSKLGDRAYELEHQAYCSVYGLTRLKPEASPSTAP